MALEIGNTALLLCVLLGAVSVSVWVEVEVGDWSEVYYIPPGFGLLVFYKLGERR